MGLALENFDAVGAWRTLDEGQPIDASGVLPDGTKVNGVDRACATVAGALLAISSRASSPRSC